MRPACSEGHHRCTARLRAAQAIANMGGAPFSVPYSVSINYAGFTGQESGWNWDSSYQGSGTITGTLSQARTSPPSHRFAGLSRREGHASGNMLAAACFRGGVMPARACTAAVTWCSE